MREVVLNRKENNQVVFLDDVEFLDNFYGVMLCEDGDKLMVAQSPSLQGFVLYDCELSPSHHYEKYTFDSYLEKILKPEYQNLKVFEFDGLEELTKWLME